MGDRRKCQTFAASPAEPGGLPVMLGISSENLIQVSLSAGRHRFALIFDGRLSERAGDIVTGASILLALSGLLLAASRSRMRKAA
jgi:hypothetical protein